MPKVEAWMCPHTKTLFHLEDERKYKNHLARLSKRRVKIKKQKKERLAFEQWFKSETELLYSPQAIANWVCDNFKKLSTFYNNEPSDGYVGIKDMQISGRYNSTCSNTHSAPKGCKTNWHGDKQLPKGYPGVYGRISYIKVGTNTSIFNNVNNTLRSIGIHTGTGGGGAPGGRTSYDGTLWLADWPGLDKAVKDAEEAYKEQTVVNILKNVGDMPFKVTWQN